MMIDRKLIKLPDPIKTIGEHEVEIRFSPEVSVMIKVQVIGVKT
jgi:large subunit ribosomal protein L9